MAPPLDLPVDPIEPAGETWEATWGPALARCEALVLLRFCRLGALQMKVIGCRLMVHPSSDTNTVDRLVAGASWCAAVTRATGGVCWPNSPLRDSAALVLPRVPLWHALAATSAE
jgi:hypothetical protein